jgi:hypothetical protein
MRAPPAWSYSVFLLEGKKGVDMNKMISLLVTMIIFIGAGCLQGPDGIEEERRGLPADRADGFFENTCNEACGEQSNLGQCWCDDSCHIWGDCCNDKIVLCGIPSSCVTQQQQASCSPCAADGACNPDCEFGTDPDCPVCDSDGFCNDECAVGEDQDCPDCRDDGLCDERCDEGEDPDCVEVSTGCDSDDDCGDEQCIAGQCRIVTSIETIQNVDIATMAAEVNGEDVVTVRSYIRNMDYYLNRTPEGEWSFLQYPYNDYMEDRWRLRSYKNHVSNVVSFAYVSNRSASGPLAMSFRGSYVDYTYAFNSDGEAIGATLDRVGADRELRLWDRYGSEIINHPDPFATNLAVRFRADGMPQILGIDTVAVVVYNKVGAIWEQRRERFPGEGQYYFEHLSIEAGVSWAVIVERTGTYRDPNSYVLRFDDDSMEVFDLEIIATRLSNLRFDSEGNIYALLHLGSGSYSILRIDNTGSITVDTFAGPSERDVQSQMAVLSDGTIVIVYAINGRGFSYQTLEVAD